MPAEKFTTVLTPFECKPFHSGTNPTTQKEFTIYQVRARNEQGQEITQYPLRSFEPLKLHEKVTVEAKLYDGGDRYGISYTLKVVGESKITNTERIEKLESQVEALYAHLGLTTPGEAAAYDNLRSQAAPAAPPPPPPGPPVAPPPGPPVAPPPPVPSVQPQPTSRFGGDDDIPF